MYVWVKKMMKNSVTVKLRQYSSVAEIIADEHSHQTRVSFPKPLGPTPAIPEQQMHPYGVIKRHVNISKCHGCEAKFVKKKISMILLRKVMDW